jgi:hypothetical protein
MRVERVGDWWWCLDRVEPEDGALDALLAAAGDHVVVQPKVLDPDGALRWFAEWPRYGDVDAIVAAAPDRVLPLRAASFHGALVREEPGPDDDGLEFTARLLRHGSGVLVPGATVRLTEEPRERTLREQWRIAGSREAWTPRERFDRRVQALVSPLNR